MFTNHDPANGRTMYGAEAIVDPPLQGHGIGGKLYATRRELIERLGLPRIRGGAPFRRIIRAADRPAARGDRASTDLVPADGGHGEDAACDAHVAVRSERLGIARGPEERDRRWTRLPARAP